MADPILSPATPPTVTNGAIPRKGGLDPSDPDSHFMSPEATEALSEAERLFTERREAANKAISDVQKLSQKRTPEKSPEKKAAPAAKKEEPVKPAESSPEAPAEPSKDIIPDPTTFRPHKTKAENWDALKQSYEGRLAKASARIAELEAAPDERVKTLTTQLDQLRGIVASVAAERDPVWQADFNSRLQSVVESAKSVSPDNAAAIESLLSMPSGPSRTRAVGEFMQTLEPWQQAQLSPALYEVDKLARERSDRARQSQANLERMQREQVSRAAEQIKNDETLFNRQVTRWQDPDVGLSLFQRKEGDSEWNAEVDASIARAKALVGLSEESGKLTRPQVIAGALWSGFAPLLLKSHNALLAENDQLKAENAALRGGSVEAGGDSGMEVSETSDVPAGTSYADALGKLASPFFSGR